MCDEAVFICPECGSKKVASTHAQLFMVNTGEHYSHSVKAHDGNSRTFALTAGGKVGEISLKPKRLTNDQRKETVALAAAEINGNLIIKEKT